MQRTMLKSKLHRATVTDANLEYEGSISIDRGLSDAADFLLFERVEIYNITNGARFATYVIEAPRGSGEICVNGAAAHLVRPGDKVIIASYVNLSDAEAKAWVPKVILLDAENRPKAEQSPTLDPLRANAQTHATPSQTATLES
jgi:aspartate 1-decarboxylase